MENQDPAQSPRRSSSRNEEGERLSPRPPAQVGWRSADLQSPSPRGHLTGMEEASCRRIMIRSNVPSRSPTCVCPLTFPLGSPIQCSEGLGDVACSQTWSLPWPCTLTLGACPCCWQPGPAHPRHRRQCQQPARSKPQMPRPDLVAAAGPGASGLRQVGASCRLLPGQPPLALGRGAGRLGSVDGRLATSLKGPDTAHTVAVTSQPTGPWVQLRQGPEDHDCQHPPRRGPVPPERTLSWPLLPALHMGPGRKDHTANSTAGPRHLRHLVPCRHPPRPLKAPLGVPASTSRPAARPVLTR